MSCIHGWKKLEFLKTTLMRLKSHKLLESLQTNRLNCFERIPFGRKWNPFHSQTGMFLNYSTAYHIHNIFASTRNFNLIHLPLSVANTSSSKNDSDVLARTPNHRSRCVLIDSLRHASSQPLYFFVSLKPQPDRSLDKWTLPYRRRPSCSIGSFALPTKVPESSQNRSSTMGRNLRSLVHPQLQRSLRRNPRRRMSAITSYSGFKIKENQVTSNELNHVKQ